MHLWDTLIVGAGPAGCAAAFDLARAGRSVLLLDRATFPRPKACAAGLTIKTLRALRYSVSPVTHRTVHTIRLEGPGAAPAAVTTRDPICVTAVREEFDLFCLQQTLSAGAQLQQIGPIASITQTEDRVTLTTATQTFHARYLLGADGANSQVRKLLHQSQPTSAPPPTAVIPPQALSASAGTSSCRDPERSAAEPKDLRSAPAQPPTPTPVILTQTQSATEGTSLRCHPERSAAEPKDPRSAPAQAANPAEPGWLTRGFALETHLPLPADGTVPDLLFDFRIPNGYAWIFPKRDHLNVGLGFFSTTPGPTARAALTDYINHHPTLACHPERSAAKSKDPRSTPAEISSTPTPLKVVGQYLSFGFPQYTPHGRVLLAGDAAGTLDPLTAEGIYPAIISGQAAAQAIHQSLSTGQPAAPVYHALTEDLRAQLTFSARAARRFYQDPSLGLRAIQLPLMRQAIVRTYALGLARPALLSRIAHYALKLRPTA